MDILKQLEITTWDNRFKSAFQQDATQAIENGQLLFFPKLAFALQEHELRFLSPDYLLPQVKNISFNLNTQKLNGLQGGAEEQAQIIAMMSRFAQQAHQLITDLFPHYHQSLQIMRTSFRPAQITDRKTSYRKDDRLLHVDAFPANPNQGKRILRVFSNINPHNEPRVWQVGEPFETVAKRFLPQISRSWWGSNWLLKALKITKSLRTDYDHIMLQIHDRMKFDRGYQLTVDKKELCFPAQSSWIVQTDHVSHAALSGQHLLEQTFYLPVNAMMDPGKSPLKVLEQLMGSKLA